jgi:hypothetical protein
VELRVALDTVFVPRTRGVARPTGWALHPGGRPSGLPIRPKAGRPPRGTQPLLQSHSAVTVVGSVTIGTVSLRGSFR